MRGARAAPCGPAASGPTQRKENVSTLAGTCPADLCDLAGPPSVKAALPQGGTWPREVWNLLEAQPRATSGIRQSSRDLTFHHPRHAKRLQARGAWARVCPCARERVRVSGGKAVPSIPWRGWVRGRIRRTWEAELPGGPAGHCSRQPRGHPRSSKTHPESSH